MKLFSFIKGALLFGLTFTSVQAGPVSYYGQMEAQGTRIYGAANGLAMQARGVSLYWNTGGWGGEGYWNRNTVNHLADIWNVDMVRAAFDPNLWPGNKWQMEEVVDAAIEKDIYVIIDFHSHHPDGDKAAWFFDELASKYGSYDNVIFEIFNEPNADYNWQNSIKPHNEKAVAAIRKHSDNLIIAGNRIWSQRADEAAADPIDDPNIAYVMHFYVGSHGGWVRDWNEVAMGRALTQDEENGDTQKPVKPVAIFASEWGYWPEGADNYKPDMNPFGQKDENGQMNMNGYDWLAFMNKFQMSWASWSMGNKNEPSSFFNGDVNNLTAWGGFMKDHISSWSNTQAPFRFAAEVSSQKTELAREELIDNVDDNGLVSFWKGAWRSEGDAIDGGVSVYTKTEDLASDGAIKLEAQFKYEYGAMWDYEAYAKVVLDLNRSGGTQDLNSCSAIQYDYKGRAHNFRVAQEGVSRHQDYHRTEVAASDSWATATVVWDNLRQPGWVTEQSEVNKGKIMSFVWQVFGPAGDSGELLVDNVACVGARAPQDADFEDEVEAGVGESSVSKNPDDVSAMSSSSSEPNDSGVSSSSQIIVRPPGEDALSSSDEISPINQQQRMSLDGSALYRLQNKEALSVTVSVAGVYTVALYDVMGNNVLQYGATSLDAGQQSLQLPRPVSNGLYVLKVNRVN